MSSQPPLKRLTLLILLVLAFGLTIPVHAQDKSAEVAQKLQGFDAFMEKTLKDWNAPGIGVGIVVNDKLVFAKGFGYRDYEKKLPITSTTLFPIAPNTDRSVWRICFAAEVTSMQHIRRLQNQGQGQQAGAGNKGILRLLRAPAPGFHSLWMNG